MQYYLKEAVRWLWLPVLFLALLAAIPALANEVDNLEGWWIGKYKSWNINSKTYTEPNLYLTIKANPVSAIFALGTGGTWETDIKIDNGKILIKIDRDMREFILKREGERLLLEASYETNWPGWFFKNKIVLEKKGN